MRAQPSAPPGSAAPRPLRLLVSLLAVVVLGTWPVAQTAEAADPRLEQAQAEQRTTQAALDVVLAKIGELEAETQRLQTELTALTDRERAQRAEADAASDAMALRVRESYKRGAADPLLALFGSGSVDEAAEQSRLLAVLARRDEQNRETASAARTRTAATAAQVEQQRAQLAAREAELAQTRQVAAEHVAAAEQQVSAVRATIAAEEAARERARRERAARAVAASRGRSRSAAMMSSSAAAGGGAPVAGGIACPVGNPHSYSDTWGASRSGGRSHKGTDILAPRGTSIPAYENGTITRMNGNRLGGISLYVRGASGNVYYYTHLQGYVSGLSAGSSVRAGQHIAFNGDTGNARGIPHLHFEVQPGGGGSVNPYPYVRRACG